MKTYLKKVLQHQYLTHQEAYDAMQEMASGNASAVQLAAYISATMMRPIAVEELAGFRAALLDLCNPVSLNQGDTIDLCGTGGDGKNTFNISTLASFVVAGSGIPVTKHGNYGVSSVSGSSNVLEYLGISFATDPSVLSEQLEKAGICFLHAPLFHPALKNVGPVRKELGVKTFFNVLGPMVNPSNPKKQLVGVFNLEVARNYNYVFQKSGKDYMILHALAGYDEISGTSPVKIYGSTGEETLYPEQIIGRKLKPEEIASGDSVKEAASIFVDVLEGRATEAQNAVVCINAAAAIKVYRGNMSWADAYATAQESLQSKKALASFKQLQEMVLA